MAYMERQLGRTGESSTAKLALLTRHGRIGRSELPLATWPGYLRDVRSGFRMDWAHHSVKRAYLPGGSRRLLALALGSVFEDTRN